MEVNAGTELQPFTSRYNSEQACMEALIAMKWPNGFVCSRYRSHTVQSSDFPAYPLVRVRKVRASNVGFGRYDFLNERICPCPSGSRHWSCSCLRAASRRFG
ncbi:hypothetical protein [Paenibacillus sp. TH7-28]